MSKRLMLAVATVLAVGSAVGATIALGQGGGGSNTTLTARLTGNNESPRGDANGVGAAGVTIVGNRVCLAISYGRLARVAAAHIHRGARGQNGPIVVDPKFTGGSGARGTLGACVTPNAGTTVSQIRSNPGGFYVNVHTSEFPGGAIRGQLSRR
jgi:CHRD domain